MRLREALDATRSTRVIDAQGNAVTVELPDHDIRLKAIRLAWEARGIGGRSVGSQAGGSERVSIEIIVPQWAAQSRPPRDVVVVDAEDAQVVERLALEAPSSGPVAGDEAPSAG